jgi:hypothetical protein
LVGTLPDKEAHMKPPDIVSTIVDQERNITYQVAAYRTLTRSELVMAVRHFWSQRKKPKVKLGGTVKIISIIGHDGH